MQVFLVGYMGSGKSTVGKALATRLDRPYFDLDREVERLEGKGIPEIFAADGEAVFRGLERKVLHRLCEQNSAMVLATGGGTPCFYDNMAYMKGRGITVYLQMDPASLAHRLWHGRGDRPLINGKSEEELREYVRQHLDEREDMYLDAAMMVPGLGFSSHKLETLADAIRRSEVENEKS